MTLPIGTSQTRTGSLRADVSVLRSFLGPLKRQVRKVLQRLGYDVVSANRPAAADARMRWIERLDIDLIADVGANKGQFVGWMRDRGYAARIISFEPQAEAFKACVQRWGGDPGWQGVHCALGETPGEIEMQLAANSVSSSILPMLQSHVTALPESHIVSSEKVKLSRLDHEVEKRLNGETRLFLKIDTQGFEMPVLRGAGALMDRVRLIEVELSLVPLYAGQALLTEVWSNIEAMGFTPIWVEQGFSDLKEARMLQVDALFVRSQLIA
jgi:FkbM family methyltransferase